MVLLLGILFIFNNGTTNMAKGSKGELEGQIDNKLARVAVNLNTKGENSLTPYSKVNMENLINVKDFSSVAATVDEASRQSGGILYFPPGEYVIDDELQFVKDIEFRGAGRSQTKISINTESGYLNKEGATFKFSDLIIDGKVRNCANHQIFPEDFGAIGNFKSDDSQAIQNAVDSGNGGALEFESGKRYLIKETVIVNIEKIKMISGNNSYLVLGKDIAGLKLVGSKNTKGAQPNKEQNIKLADKQFMPIVSDLQIYSTSDNYEGTGVQVEGTFGLILKNNHLFSLKTGIQFIGYNRNVIIEDNQIWNMRDYGIHWSKVNLHQQIIENNHISFTRKNLFFEDSDVHNIHIIGNDLEGGGGEKAGNDNSIHFLLSKGSFGDMSQIQISGNSIEEHLLGRSSLLKFENHTGDTSKMQIIEITGNEFSGSKSSATEFMNTSNVTINGNNFYGNQAFNLKVLHKASGFNITGNAFSGDPLVTGNKGVLHLHSGTDVSNFIVYANTADHLHGPPVHMKSPSSNAKSGGQLKIEGMNISNNIFSMDGNYQSNGEYLVDIAASRINGFVYTNNQLKGCKSCSNGTRITANSISHSIINKNLTYNVNGNVNKYKLPQNAGSVIVSENK